MRLGLPYCVADEDLILVSGHFRELCMVSTEGIESPL